MYGGPRFTYILVKTGLTFAHAFAAARTYAPRFRTERVASTRPPKAAGRTRRPRTLARTEPSCRDPHHRTSPVHRGSCSRAWNSGLRVRAAPVRGAAAFRFHRLDTGRRSRL